MSEPNREQIVRDLERIIRISIDLNYEFPRITYSKLRDTLSIIKELAEEDERLRAALGTDISIVRLSRGNGKTALLREVARVRMDAVRADTVRKMQAEIEARCIKGGIYPAFVKSTIDQIAKEMMEGEK